MTLHHLLRRFSRDCSAASSAEFALVVTPFLLFLLGIIDAGRFIWLVNENEKAAQIGARWAVATDMVCDGLNDWSFVVNESPAVTQGNTVPKSAFPGVDFAGGSATTCTCKSGGTCSFPLSADTAAFGRLVDRMRQIQPRLTADNVAISYDWSGLGYAGDPNGPDVAPTVTVTVRRLGFRPLFLAQMTEIGSLGAQYSLTMEDASGSFSN